MDNKELKNLIAIQFIGAGIDYLIKKGRVEAEDVNHKWNVVFESNSLEIKNFAAGSGLSPSGKVYVCFHPDLSIEAIKFAAAHEVVHLVQLCLGEMIPQGMKTIWKKQEHGNLPAEDPGYELQPWEAEAHMLQDEILKHINEIFPAPQ